MPGQTADQQVKQAEIDAALADLFATPAFARSDRMRAFLSYVVGETLAGRGDKIRAKTIAQDVYGRDPAKKDYSENIVRVDARRLRRLLESYYNGEGAGAAIRIQMDPGSYVPGFEKEATGSAANAALQSWAIWRQQHPLGLAAIAATFFAAAIIGAVFSLSPSVKGFLLPESESERHALFQRSGAVLQADNLCIQGRGMLFPIADSRQQAAATGLFRHAQELAPDYACGYAGIAHSLATSALLTPSGEEREDLLSEALRHGEQAQALAPKDGWALSGLAWAEFANGDLQEAEELSQLSAQLSPTDGNVLDFHGVISILVGNYDEALRATDPARQRDTNGLGHAQRNIYGAASFHAGDYDSAIQAWEDAIQMGEPVSPLTMIYLAAAHEARGDRLIAEKYVRDLQEGWPNFPAAAVLAKFYPDPAVSRMIITLLEDAGWRAHSADQDHSNEG